jgi:ankyrin repeat protein
VNPSWEAAARNGDLQRLKQLHAQGASLDQLDRYGQTALMLAAVRGHAEVARWLAECGANLNHTAKYGLSALMLAVLRGHIGVARALLAAGADQTLRGSGAPDFDGKTALDLARDAGNPQLVELLSMTSGEDPG